MKTTHQIFYQNAKQLKKIKPESIDLMVTSPPYPMIEMWDAVFSNQNHKIQKALKQHDGTAAFDLMHRELDRVWAEVYRVLKKGGIAAVNIGDATRTINDHFALYANHSRILHYMQKIGFSVLPAVLWRKQTNAPNKFMGSGMMPPGAYVTLEHEYVLILRKGNKKEFHTPGEKQIRRESAFFWEERNVWFSDVWMDLKGTTQNLFEPNVRNRSAAFPFELPYRLISMFSVKGDSVLDPFLGLGTTMYAAMAACRNSIGFEIDTEFKNPIESRLSNIVDYANLRIRQRLDHHFSFTENHFKRKGKFKYQNKHYLFPVVTRQETDLLINELQAVKRKADDTFEATYSDSPQNDFVGFWDGYMMTESEKEQKKLGRPRKKKTTVRQVQLFD
ncbi:DNA-methyltransferase [Thermodesulfobacteriota bacterium]